MALDNIIKQTTNKPVEAQSSTTLVSTSTSVETSSKPIVALSTEKKSDPITDAIRNNEFLKLSPEEQLKKLKKLFPDISEKELTNTLTVVKSTIEKEKAGKTSENVPQDQLKSSQKADKGELLITDYAKKLGNDATIDDVIANIKSKKPSELTPSEKKILEFLSVAQQKNKDEILSTIGKYADDIDKLITIKDYPNWNDKTPKEKLNLRIDVVLKNMIPNFDKLPKEQQEIYASGMLDNFGKMVTEFQKKKDPDTKDWDKLSPAEKEFKKSQFAALVDVAENSHLTTKELLLATKEQRQEIVLQYGSKALDSYMKNDSIDVISKTYLDRKTDDKLNEIALSAIGSVNKNFDSKNVTKEQKEQAELWINNIGKHLVPDWDTMSKDEKDTYKSVILNKINAAKYGHCSIEEYIKMSPSEQIKIEDSYFKKIGQTKTPYDKIVDHIRVKNNSIVVTEDQVLDYLKAKSKKSGLTKEEQIEYANIKNQRKHFGTKNHPIDDRDSLERELRTSAYQDKATGKIDYNKYIENNYSKDDVSGADYLKTHPHALSRLLRKRCQDNETIKGICKVLGIDPTQYLKKDSTINAVSYAEVTHNKRGVTAGLAEAHQAGFKEVIIDTAASIPEHFKKRDDRFDLGKTIIKMGPEYAPAVAQSWNNTKYVTKEDAKYLGKSLDESADVSNASKAVFTKAFISTASNDETRIEYAKALSPIKNIGVTEGLAAASNSVTSPSARKQYDNYVDNAVNNYPPEERASVRAAVNQARETGEISQSTLSKTNHSENTSDSKPSDKTSSSGNNNKTHNTEGRTSTSSVPQTSSTSTAKNPKTVTSQNVDKAKETQILQQKKEALLDKIDKYETKKAEEIKKREEAKKSSEAGSADSPSSAEKTSSTQETDKVEKEEKTSTSVSDIQLSEDEQKTLKEVIIQTVKTQGIAAAFGELSSSHQDKLLEVFAQKGKESDVRSFADSYRGSESTLLKIYNYTQSESLRLDILRIMPSSSIKQLLNSQKIGKADFDKLVSENKVDSDVIFDYINKNRAGMSIDEMKKYSKYLSLDYQIELNRLISQKSAETKGSDDWQIAQQENMRTFPSEVTDSYSEDLAMENGLPLGSNKMSMRGQYDKMKKNGPFFMKA